MRRVRVDSPLGQVVQLVAGSAGFAKVAPHVLPPLDRALHRATGGRVVLSQAMLPSLVLTTTGARTGLPRRTPLATLPVDGNAFVVVGSNFGRADHPGWTANLLKTPDATVSYRGRTIPVVATLLSDAEKAQVWPRLTAMWPTYNRYVERSHRDLRIFRLTPRA